MKFRSNIVSCLPIIYISYAKQYAFIKLILAIWVIIIFAPNIALCVIDILHCNTREVSDATHEKLTPRLPKHLVTSIIICCSSVSSTYTPYWIYRLSCVVHGQRVRSECKRYTGSILAIVLRRQMAAVSRLLKNAGEN